MRHSPSLIQTSIILHRYQTTCLPDEWEVTIVAKDAHGTKPIPRLGKPVKCGLQRRRQLAVSGVAVGDEGPV